MLNFPMDKKEYSKRIKQTKFKIFINKILNIIARFMVYPWLRIKIYKIMGINIGKNVFIGLDSYLDDQFPELIKIEDDVIIAFRVILTTHDDSNGTVAPVIIKKGAYIGAGAIVLAGVTIGENAIIGAGAVVNKDIPSNCVAVGVPAKVINMMNH